MNLLVSSHYRNTPDDLQILSDAPAHHIFVLLPPTGLNDGLPEVFCIIQVRKSFVSFVTSSYFNALIADRKRTFFFLCDVEALMSSYLCNGGSSSQQ